MDPQESISKSDGATKKRRKNTWTETTAHTLKSLKMECRKPFDIPSYYPNTQPRPSGIKYHTTSDDWST